ncbi:hypothetical protein V9K67_23715 [Paraflavisolibacter sp. H34]|uniref:hypothetical protein n=1 Tax=Huijunlia imazamoxiresistens TaxID=3127457 RepID=UPI0030177D2D
MKRFFLFLFPLLSGSALSAQQVDSIYFHLYTDSLKKGFYNYINVDGKYTDGSWLPLDSNQVQLSANTGYFKGNDLFIDSSYTGETVRVKALLKSRPEIWREVTIYIRKRPLNEPLKTENDVFSEGSKRRKK